MCWNIYSWWYSWLWQVFELTSVVKLCLWILFSHQCGSITRNIFTQHFSEQIILEKCKKKSFWSILIKILLLIKFDQNWSKFNFSFFQRFTNFRNNLSLLLYIFFNWRQLGPHRIFWFKATLKLVEDGPQAQSNEEALGKREGQTNSLGEREF